MSNIIFTGTGTETDTEFCFSFKEPIIGTETEKHRKVLLSCLIAGTWRKNRFR